MPKLRRESDYGRFRIISVGNKYIVEERIFRFSVWHIWNSWKPVESYGYPFEFISVQEAKDYIDLKIEKEINPPDNTGVILYP